MPPGSARLVGQTPRLPSMAQGLLLLRPFVGSAIAALLPSNASNLKSAQLYREPCFSTESTDSRQSDSGAE